MTPRTILVTGKGGVGKTSVAAATALRCAAAGHRTLVLSTDPAHSLSASLETELGPEPIEVSARGSLWGQEIDAQAEMSRHWASVGEWLGEVLVDRGIDRISAEELTVPPGMDELFSLLRLQAAVESGSWDVVVVDCAPTGETIRMLSVPEIARWWIDRAFPVERALRGIAAGPLARSILDLPVPGSSVFGELRALSEKLIAMNGILRDRSSSSVRLVMGPDRMVIGETMRTFTYLNLYGYLTDAVVVNKVLPDGVGPYFDAWRERQAEHLELVRTAFSPVPVLRAPWFQEEVVGVGMLDELAGALYAPRGGVQAAVGGSDATPAGSGPDAASILHDRITQEIVSDDDGARLRLSIPFTRKEDISVKQVGPELVVTVPGQRRTIVLPTSLAALTPVSARYDEDALEVRFAHAG